MFSAHSEPSFCDFVRGIARPHFVFVAQLRTKQPAAKWVLAGVAIILDIGHDLSKCHVIVIGTMQ